MPGQSFEGHSRASTPVPVEEPRPLDGSGSLVARDIQPHSLATLPVVGAG